MRGTFFLAELLLTCLALWLFANILHYIVKTLSGCGGSKLGFFSLSDSWSKKAESKGKK